MYKEVNFPAHSSNKDVIPEIPILKFGYDLNLFQLEEKTIKQDEFISDILKEEGVSYSYIHSLATNSKDVYDVRNLQAGKNYVMIKDSCSEPEAFVYIPNKYRYIKE